MEIIILIVCIAVGQAFPFPKVGYSVENALVLQDKEKSPMISDLTLENTVQKSNKSSNKAISDAIEKINSLKVGRSRTFGTLASFAVGGLLAALDLVEEVIEEKPSARITQLQTAETENIIETTTDLIPTAISDSVAEYQTPTEMSTTTDLIFDTTSFPTTIDYNMVNQILNEIQENSKKARQIRQGSADGNVTNELMSENQEEDDEGGGGGLIGAIISGFLGSLSKPDGSVDVDAVVSVIGMLSAMRDDGSYDFSGLTDTLNAFFGGDDDGGSDVGSFAGGLVAAIIAGVANNPPGAKGAGTFLGNLLRQVLPALSGPGPTAEGVTTVKPQVNAGGFLWGLLNSLFGGNGNGTTPGRPNFLGIKMNLVKYAFSAVSSILTSSSGGKNNRDW